MSYIERNSGTSACGGMGGIAHPEYEPLDTTNAFRGTTSPERRVVVHRSKIGSIEIVGTFELVVGPRPRFHDFYDHSLSEDIDFSYAVLSGVDEWLQRIGRLQRSTSALHNLRGETTPEHVAREHADDTPSRETTRAAVHELRRLSGLTWDQLARLFGVDRRSLHHWGSGQPLSRKNEERLHRLLTVIRYIDRGAADLNRQALLQPTANNALPFDLLVQGKDQEVKAILGQGPGRRIIQRKPLSPEARAARYPVFTPEELVDARHEPVHVEMKGSRVPRVARSRKEQ